MKMACAICVPSNQDIPNGRDDCVVKYLEKIKTHFDYYKSQIADSQRTIERLNRELTESREKTNWSPKRRKTNSFEYSPAHLESTNDSLNDAIKCDASWDDSTFFQPSQPPPKVTPDNILKPHNESPTRKNADLRHSSPAQLLPRRISMKTSLSMTKARQSVEAIPTTPVQTENRKPKWNCKENLKSSAQKRSEWSNMSFIQPSVIQKMCTPVKEKKCTPVKEQKCSPVREKKSSPVREKESGPVKGMSPPAVKRLSEANLKQTRLTFSVKRESNTLPDSDETFCEDFVTPSPTSFASSSDETSKPRQRTLRKQMRSKQQHSSHNKTIIEPNPKIKNEPSTVKKVLNLDTKPKVPSYKDLNLTPVLESTDLSGIEAHADNSSLIILPSQPDDVIIVEETDDNSFDLNIDSAALIDEMMVKSDETSDFLKNIENQCILNSKNLNDKRNETKTATSKIIPKWNCKECESYYRIAGRDLSDKELRNRMEKCAAEHRPAYPATPDGFWNPLFPPTQDDDPRNLTLIDTRRVDKKTSN